MAAAGRQAARNARHKPDAVAEANDGPGRSRSKATSQLGMSLEEAHLILNTKKTDNMETIMGVSSTRLCAGSPGPAPRRACVPEGPRRDREATGRWLIRRYGSRALAPLAELPGRLVAPGGP